MAPRRVRFLARVFIWCSSIRVSCSFVLEQNYLRLELGELHQPAGEKLLHRHPSYYPRTSPAANL